MDKDKRIADLELQLTNCRDTFNAYQVDYKILKQHLEEAQSAYVSAYDTGYTDGMDRAAEIADNFNTDQFAIWNAHEALSAAAQAILAEIDK